MKMFNSICRGFIFLSMTCALLCAFENSPVFAQDGREALEVARQKERLHKLAQYSDLNDQAEFVNADILKTGQLLYRFLLTSRPQDAAMTLDLAKDITTRLQQMREQTQNEPQIQRVLDELEKALADYTTHFDILLKDSPRFSAQYERVLSPLTNQLETKTSELASMAAATNYMELYNALTYQTKLLNRFQDFIASFYHRVNQYDSDRAMGILHSYATELQTLKESAKPEMQTMLSEISKTATSLQLEFELFRKIGTNIAGYYARLEDSLDNMEELSRELVELSQAMQNTARDDIARNVF